MIDVSDGLLADLGHICETSQVAAVVELDSVPLSVAAQAFIVLEPTIAPRLAAGGDDYELLFTAPAAATERNRRFGARPGTPITAIGRIEAGAGVRLVGGDGRQIAVEATGYRHF